MTTPPHLATPRIEHVTVDGLEGYLRQVLHGFHAEFHAETPELDRQVFLPERTFGHRVDGQWVSTAGSYPRRLTVPGGASVPTAAVTIVTVSPSYRRRGLLRELMTYQLRATHELGEPIALLWASESLIYGRFGYGAAVPRASLSGATRSTAFLPDVDLGPGSVAEVEETEFLTAAPGLHQELLGERPGALDRPDPWWEFGLYDPERDRDGWSARRYLLLFSADGDAAGYATFRIKKGWGLSGPDGEVKVEEVDARDPAGYARLWRFLLDVDLVRRFSRDTAPIDDPLQHLVVDPRAVQRQVTDATHLRLVDVRRALELRAYPVETDLVLRVVDPLLEHNDGRWRLTAGPDGAAATATRDDPDLTLSVKDLGAVYLGGVGLGALAAAGRVQEDHPGAVARGAAAFGWTRDPFTPDHF